MSKKDFDDDVSDILDLAPPPPRNVAEWAMRDSAGDPPAVETLPPKPDIEQAAAVEDDKVVERPEKKLTLHVVKEPPKQKPPSPPKAKPEPKPPRDDKPKEEKLQFRKTSGTYAEPYECEDGTKKIKWPLSMPEEFVERHRRVAALKLPAGLTRSDWALEVLSRELDRIEGKK